MEIQGSPDIAKRIRTIAGRLSLDYIDTRRVICMRTLHATSRARARIWGFPRMWQMALGISPHYVIEVLSQHYDHLSDDDKTRTLIHELMHIPRNFSGALVPHKGRYKRIDRGSIEKLFATYKNGKDSDL